LKAQLCLTLVTGFLCIGCSGIGRAKRSYGLHTYPPHWWQAVDPVTAPDWEILPQQADSGTVILSKRNELGLLSNFAETPFTLDGVSYASLEGFWQMMKFPEQKSEDLRNQHQKWPHTRKEISQMTGFAAKRAGKKAEAIMKQLGVSWISYQGKILDYKGSDQKAHYELILRASKAKLKQNPRVKKVLCATRGLRLMPDHKQKQNSPPAWRYFKIYEELRTKDCP